MIYKIEKGNHFANFTFNRLFPFSWIPLKKTIKFDEKCWYKRDDIEYTGYNKLIGVSGFGIHNNSARLVWQPDFSIPRVIRLYGYVYKDGAHWVAKYICSVVTNTEFKFELRFVDNKWEFNVENKHGIGSSLRIDGTKPKILFKAYPYFGGKSTAPHDIKIEVE